MHIDHESKISVGPEAILVLVILILKRSTIANYSIIGANSFINRAC